MIKGIEISAQGLEAMVLQQSIIANNLANTNTVGFKGDALLLNSFRNVLSNKLGVTGGALRVDDVAMKAGQGALTRTGGTFDVALQGDGFFTVDTPDGPRYTRGGNFTVNSAGGMVTQGGLPVLGGNGPIIINGNAVEITAQGDIMVDGKKTNTIKVVDFAKPYKLKKIGNNLLDVVSADVQPAEKPAQTEVVQGFLESSSVQVVQEMVRMIECLRAFELNQKAILTQDELTNKAINDVGRTK
jgi:flagellar basal-body rod protein FlgF